MNNTSSLFNVNTEQTSGGGPKMDKNTGKHTRPLNKPNTVLAINIRKYDLQSKNQTFET